MTINQSVGVVFERFDNAPHTPDVLVTFNQQELVLYMAPQNQWKAGDFHAHQFLFESEKQRLDVDDVQKHRQRASLFYSRQRDSEVSYSVCTHRTIAVGKPKATIALYRNPMLKRSYAPEKSRPIMAAWGSIALGDCVSDAIFISKFRTPTKLSAIWRPGKPSPPH